MNRFAIAQPDTFEQAGQVLTDRRFSLPALKAGGMDVLDHLKEGLVEPDVLVNIKNLSLNGAAGVSESKAEDGASLLRVEATTTLAEIAASTLVQSHAPVVAQALEDAASPQVRNVATAAGNLLQRPRCWYYRSAQFNCNKKGGDQCFARHGENKFHAVFWRGPCVIVHPSNLAPALYVTGGVAHVMGGDRESIPMTDLYHMPHRGVLDEHNLQPGEIITHITFEPAPASGFYAVKEKQSFDWPLAMAAAALELDGSRIVSARICAGAVAPVPWPLPAVEQALAGVDVDDENALKHACAISVDGAEPLSDNAYKLKLLPVVVRRAILKAAGRNVEADS